MPDARRFSTPQPWDRWSTSDLLDLRLCDLGVQLEGTWVEGAVKQVHGELASRQLKAKPHVYLADEWMSPDDIPAVALPFYLVHPRLMRLERSQMLEAEGANLRECTMLLRHEMGHAIQHAYQLQRRPRFRRMFGRVSTPYPERYRPNPASKRFVQHLDGWYAQAHPVEDFAETFAVWLTKRPLWRRRYAGWAALKKLEYVDELMAELAGQTPTVKSRARPFALRGQRRSLREYYKEKQGHYGPTFSGGYDRDLKRIFDGGERQGESAAAFLRRHRKEIRNLVARWTGEYTFTVDQVLKQMIGRCVELKLRTRPGWSTESDFAVLLTVHTMTYLYRTREVRAV